MPDSWRYVLPLASIRNTSTTNIATFPWRSFAHDNHTYRVFDKPSVGKLIITPSLVTAMSDGVIRNATFGRYNNRTERDTLETAASAYLARHGRKCTITDGSMVYDPQWEFTYVCEIVYTAQP